MTTTNPTSIITQHYDGGGEIGIDDDSRKSGRSVHKDDDKNKSSDIIVDTVGMEDRSVGSFRSAASSDGSRSVHSGNLFRRTSNLSAESSLHSSIRDFLNPKKQSPIEFFIKIVIFALLLALAIYTTVDYHYSSQSLLQEYGETFINWVEENPALGLYTFVFVYALTIVLFVPSVILMVGAGFAFVRIFGFTGGLFVASCAVFLGESIAAIASFLLARYLFRSQMTRIAEQYVFFKALDVCFTENGLPIMCLLRFSPATPFAVINYLAGITGIPFVNYFLSLFAVIPPTIMFVFIGSSASSLQGIQERMRNHNHKDEDATRQEKIISIIVVLAGIVSSAAAIFVTVYYTKKEIDRILLEMDANEYNANADKTDSTRQDEESQLRQKQQPTECSDEYDELNNSEFENIVDYNAMTTTSDRNGVNNDTDTRNKNNNNLMMNHHWQYHQQQQNHKKQQLQKFTSIQQMQGAVQNNEDIIKNYQQQQYQRHQLWLQAGGREGKPYSGKESMETVQVGNFLSHQQHNPETAGRKRTVLRIVHKNNSFSSNATTTSASSMSSINTNNTDTEIFTDEIEDLHNHSNDNNVTNIDIGYA